VRVCDKCEIALRESSKEISEEIDVTDQINVSLKASLKEKVHELEKFESLIMHYANSAAASTSNANQAERERLQSFSQNVGKICADLGEISTSYSDLKMSAKELESEIRLVAQRCMRAESIAREGTEISREIEKYSKQIGSQDRLILQLNERIQRLSAAPSVPSSPPPRRSSVQSPSSPAPRTVVFSASPSVIRSEETTVVAPSVNVVQVLKALVSI
jgi:chromosome segregation ATPase